MAWALEDIIRSPIGALAAGRDREAGIDTKPRRRGQRALKRVLDVTAAAFALVVLSPLLAGAAIAILLSDGRPVLFRQVRPGLNGKPFTIVKYRTMRQLRPGEIAWLTDDQRVTRVGRFMRASSIDELPELWNVLRGEMSLVGPRPLLMEYVASYSPRHRRRHDVRPGITSWAAVNGRHSLKFVERLELDVWYVEHQTLRLDLRILGMTIKQVLGRSHVTVTQGVADIGFPLPQGSQGDGQSGRDDLDDSDGRPT